MIEGLEIKDLITHSDERGSFREIIRQSDSIFKEGFGQCSHAVIYPGIAKAWHIHKLQIDWIYVATGLLKAAFYDTRENSKTFGQTEEILLGENQKPKVVKVPYGIAHGYKCLLGPAHIFYIMSKEYNPKDEGRIPHDDKNINYDWTSFPEIK